MLVEKKMTKVQFDDIFKKLSANASKPVNLVGGGSVYVNGPRPSHGDKITVLTTDKAGDYVFVQKTVDG